MSNTVLLTLGRELDVNGVTVPGAKAYFYEAGTTTPITVYTDTAASIAHPSPVEADAGGLFPACYVTASTAKAVITKADDSALRTIDPCPILSVTGVGASGVSFAPTVDIPATNVQDAIVLAAATAAAGFAAYGLGITGNAPTLADIDATNIGSGEYRTTAATTGTFPTGITAASTSIIAVLRETAALAVMHLMDDTEGRSWTRWMVASAWGAWKENITMPMASAVGTIPVMGATGPTSAAAGASGTVLSGSTGAAPSMLARLIELSTAATTSGTTVDFTGIPSWARNVKVFLRSVSGSGTNYLGLRVGHSGGLISTGYVSGGGIFGDSGNTDTFGVTTRFLFTGDQATANEQRTGVFDLVRFGTVWHCNVNSMRLDSGSPTTPLIGSATGYIDMGAFTLDRVQLLWSGADTFDLGNACVIYT